jgi:LysR family transcriptional regulator, transcriptional activator of nhaA
MDWLNYHHLYYFWHVAREGSVTKASEKLHLSQPTVSAQISSLEKALGADLFIRSGRHLVPTDAGKLVLRYADSIFPMGQELLDVVKGSTDGRPRRLSVGIVDAMQKLIVYELLSPAMRLTDPVQLDCREDNPDRLLADLSVHALDVVLSDAPMPPTVRVRAFNHLLGECGAAVFGTAKLAARYKRKFPASLTDAPFLLPGENSVLRRSLDEFFGTHAIRPRIIGEFDDNALLKVFAQNGAGLFAAPAAVRKQICRQYNVVVVGMLEKVRERFYAISIERKLTHPAVTAILEEARRGLFLKRG